jgi:hypothetical protein
VLERDVSHIPSDIRKRKFLTIFTFATQYTTGIDDKPEYKYLEASDVRRQVQEAPSTPSSKTKYPVKYHNNSPLPLRAQPSYKEFPVVPSPHQGSTPVNYVHGEPGPVRAFYDENDLSEFDVGFHDPQKPPLGPRNGKPYPNRPYTLATYRPAPTYIDTSTIKRP